MPRMTPSEAVVETMAVHGVAEIFGIMGSAFMERRYSTSPFSYYCDSVSCGVVFSKR